MKMTQTHYSALLVLMRSTSTMQEHGITKLTDVYMREHSAGALHAQDINKRLRWDLLRCIADDTRKRMMDDFYTYLNDDHIDTALKHIINDLMDEAAFNASGDGADTPMEKVNVEIVSITVH